MRSTLKHSACSILAGSLVLGGIIVGCKPTEAGYREAYERTIQAQRRAAEEMEADGFIREKQRTLVATSRGDTVEVRSLYLHAVAADGKTTTTEGMQRYNVVVGQFRQIFNASSMLGRMREAGYEHSVILVDTKPEYYVVAESFPGLAEANELAKAIAADKDFPIRMAEDFPYILESARHRR